MPPLAQRLRRSLQTTALACHIARHYLFSRERQALEWVVTFISIAGVAVGVGTIIAVFGVMDGMKEKVIGNITAMWPSLSIHNPNWYEGDVDPAVFKTLRARRDVLLAEPILSQGAMISYTKSKLRVGNEIFATDGLGKVNLFNVELPTGVEMLRPESGKLLVCSSLTTRSLVGEEAVVASGKLIKTALYPVPKRKAMTVQTTFTMKNSYFSERIAFATWDDVRELALKEKGIDSIYVRLKEPMTAPAVKAELLQRLPKGTTITSWTDDFAQMFTDMKILSVGMLLVMLMTMVVAALNIIGTLTLIVIQKTREIGILKAMGASRRLVGRIFLAEGALVGVVGSALGAALGVGFCLALKLYKIPMPGGMFQMNQIPVKLSGATVGLTVAAAIVICTTAALAPAWRAGGLNPVEALRHE